MEIILIIGLPGSGKSHLAPSFNGVVVDDPKSFDEMPDQAERLVICDCNLIFPNVREKAIAMLMERYPGCQIAIHSFTNNPSQCLENVRKRMEAGDTRNVISFISSFSKDYQPVGIIHPCYGE